jgi:GNAT superfamily N-acetyltransferase
VDGSIPFALVSRQIRAFFIDPKHSRKGPGTALLDHCEAAARERGFKHCELMGTLPGVRLYAGRGCVALPLIRYPVGPDITIEFVPMRKRIGQRRCPHA